MKYITFSIIIANHNDHDMVDRLLTHLFETDLNGCDKNYEIIIINDGSNQRYVLPDNYADHGSIKIYNRNYNLGVGSAFDYGVSRASGEYIVLMGADTYVSKKGWIGEAIARFNDITTFGRGIMCFANKGDNPSIPGKHGLVRSGAEIVWKMDGTNVSSSHGQYGNVTYRDIIQAKWLPDNKLDLFPVPCILGAVYLTTKSFYNHIAGFEGHRVWGGLEPLISIKTWMAGASCWVDKNIITSHTYSRTSKTPDMHHYYANKIFIAQSLLRPDQSRALLKYFCNVSVRMEALKLSYVYLYQKKELIEYLGAVLYQDVRDIEILNYNDKED